MNARQRRKIQKIKDGPWAHRLWRGKAWSSSHGRWLRLYPVHPEIQFWIDQYESCRGTWNALSTVKKRARREKGGPLRSRADIRWFLNRLIK